MKQHTAISTTKRHTITVNREECKRNLITSFMDLINDDCKDEDDIDIVEADIHRLTDCLDQINKGNFRAVFNGYTSMILNPSAFQYVEEFFREYSNSNEELEIILVDKDGNKEIIEEKYISY